MSHYFDKNDYKLYLKIFHFMLLTKMKTAVILHLCILLSLVLLVRCDDDNDDDEFGGDENISKNTKCLGKTI